MQALIVRPMLPADLAAAAAIEACAPEAWTAGQLPDELAAQQAGGAPRLFVAAGEAGLLGLAVYQLAAGEANLCTLTVAPAARRQGVGRALLEQSLAALKAEGACSCPPPTPRPWRCTGGWALPVWACAGAFTAPLPRTRSSWQCPCDPPFSLIR